MARTSVVIHSFSAVEASTDQAVAPRHGMLTCQIHGTFSGTIELRRRRFGGTWTVFQTYTNADFPVDVDVRASSRDFEYDLNCSARASGTANGYLGADR